MALSELVCQLFVVLHSPEAEYAFLKEIHYTRRGIKLQHRLTQAELARVEGLNLGAAHQLLTMSIPVALLAALVLHFCHVRIQAAAHHAHAVQHLLALHDLFLCIREQDIFLDVWCYN